MTVTKAAAEGATTGRSRFEFDAKDAKDDEDDEHAAQSADRVMVPGFQTLASCTSADVGEQNGVVDPAAG